MTKKGEWVCGPKSRGGLVIWIDGFRFVTQGGKHR
jgi:hypothetical protein